MGEVSVRLANAGIRVRRSRRESNLRGTCDIITPTSRRKGAGGGVDHAVMARRVRGNKKTTFTHRLNRRDRKNAFGPREAREGTCSTILPHCTGIDATKLGLPVITIRLRRSHSR